jgi:hypothetical protein
VIADLHHTFNQVESDTQLESEVDLLRQDVDKLQSQSASLQKRVQRTVSKRRKFDNECQICRTRRKETSNQVRGYRKVANDAEEARAGLLTRKVALEAASNPSSGLPSVIMNLEKELQSIANEIERLDEQIREYEDQTASVAIPTTALSGREQDRAADWMQGMDEDLMAIEAAVRTRKADLDESLKGISRLGKRYSILCLLAIMWKKKREPQDTNVTEMEMDDLLSRLPKEEPSSDGRIAHLQRDMNQKMRSFVVEEIQIKKQIHKQREQSVGLEKRIQNEICDLKLKMALKTFH